jgi:hypothetical protein
VGSIASAHAPAQERRRRHRRDGYHDHADHRRIARLGARDRRVLYGLPFLGATRFGEASARTWRDYDPACSPEDLIVPSRRGKHRNANHMLRRFHEDLTRPGLRVRRQDDARRTL